MNAYRIREPHVVSETLEGETIVIDLRTGTYYSMNEAATVLWILIQKHVPLDVSQNAAAADFIQALRSDDLIVEVEAADAEAHVAVDTPVLQAYTDMQEMILADPIHDVDQAGWPFIKKDA